MEQDRLQRPDHPLALSTMPHTGRRTKGQQIKEKERERRERGYTITMRKREKKERKDILE